MGPDTTKWAHVSASQIKTYRRCARKWWFEKIEGRESTTSAAAELGRAIHAQLEGYLLSGERPESPIALAGLSHLPSHEDNILVEAEFSLEDGLAKKAIGFIDLVEVDVRRVTDHKTTSDFRWAKGEYELMSDPQAILYCKHADDALLSGSGDIEFRHVYYRTRGTPASMTTSVVMTPDVLEEGFAGVAETVDGMVEHSTAPSAKEVLYNAQACRDFGGCPFRGECAKLGVKTYGEMSSLFAPQTKKKKNKEEPMSFLNKLKSKPNKNVPVGRSREQILEMVKLLSPESTDAELQDMDTSALTKLEKHLSAKRAKEVLSEAYINPPDGTPMDKRVEVALKEKKAAKKQGKDVKLTLDGHVRSDVTWKGKSSNVLPDGREIRKMGKKDVQAAYWEFFNQLDAAQRAAWYSVSSIKEETLLAAKAGQSPSVPVAQLREDIRIISDILTKAPTDDNVTEEYKKVQNAIVSNQVGHPEILVSVTPKEKKPRKPRKRKPKQATHLPEELGGAALTSIRASDYPDIARRVLFDTFDEDHVDRWVSLADTEGHPLGSRELKQWVYDGCPDKHSLKRSDIQNALRSFLTMVDNAGVDAVEQTDADGFVSDDADADCSVQPDRGANESVESESATSPPATEEAEEDEADVEAYRWTLPEGVESEERVLYIGCMPMNEEVVFLHDYLLKIQEMVAEDAAVLHYSLIKYNEGPKRVAAILRQKLHEKELVLPKFLVCDPNSPCAAAVLEVLKPVYDRIVVRVS